MLLLSFIKNTAKVSVNGITTQSLIDTGAEISCISQSFLAKVMIGKPILAHSSIYSIIGIGQQRLRVLGKINLPLKINDKCFNFEFHVIDSLPHSLIIGIDFLKTNKVTIDMSQNTMNISDENAKVCFIETKSGLARSIEKCVISAYTEAVLPVHVSRRIQGESVLLEPVDDLSKRSLIAPRCVITVDRGKSIFTVINPTNKPVKLPAYYVIAKVVDIDLQCIQTLGNFESRVNNLNGSYI